MKEVENDIMLLTQGMWHSFVEYMREYNWTKITSTEIGGQVSSCREFWGIYNRPSVIKVPMKIKIRVLLMNDSHMNKPVVKYAPGIEIGVNSIIGIKAYVTSQEYWSDQAGPIAENYKRINELPPDVFPVAIRHAIKDYVTEKKLLSFNPEKYLKIVRSVIDEDMIVDLKSIISGFSANEEKSKPIWDLVEKELAKRKSYKKLDRYQLFMIMEWIALENLNKDDFMNSINKMLTAPLGNGEHPYMIDLVPRERQQASGQGPTGDLASNKDRIIQNLIQMLSNTRSMLLQGNDKLGAEVIYNERDIAELIFKTYEERISKED